MSIEEYFKEKMKQKMLAIAGGNANGTNGTNDTKSVDQLAVEEEHSAVDDGKPEKKKNKKKYKDEEEPLPPPVEETGASETVSSKKQKRKRENIEPIEEILAVEEITEVLVEPESELSQMIKKKKKSKKALPEPESTVGETDEVAQEEHVEDAAIYEEPAKKKKKSRKSKIDDSMETDGTETHKTFEDTNETTTNEVAQEEHVEDVDAIAEEPTRKKKKSKKCKIDESMESDINETPVTHKSIEETNEMTTNEVAKEAHVEDVAAIAEEPAKKKRKSKKDKIGETNVTEDSKETVPLETSEPAMKIKTSKNNKDKVDAESKSNGKDNMNTIEETQTPTTLQQNLPPSAELPPMEDEEELTCKVKVHVLKYLDESRFNGSNFGDIIGYRLTEQIFEPWPGI
uniref:Uncharacterized protein n=1 Tax=Anopheles maculatus TaxID=74869 RepID=A0A182SY34_9DIPT